MEFTDKTFGIISEGITDQVVLEHILWAFTGNKDLSITALQPKPNEMGNWDKVFNYCKSDDFKGAFGFCDFVIIQIDTDFMHSGEVPDAYKIDMNGLSSVEEIVAVFKQKIVELIGLNFYETYQSQIIFAISVNEIECWFLPIYFSTQKKKAAKIVNCIDTLNTILPQKEGIYIHEKKIEYFEKIAKHFLKKQTLKKCESQNISLQLFLAEMNDKVV